MPFCGGVLSGVGGLFWLTGVTRLVLNTGVSTAAVICSGTDALFSLVAPGGVGGRWGEVGKMVDTEGYESVSEEGAPASCAEMR
jgi:hypothetical protein